MADLAEQGGLVIPPRRDRPGPFGSAQDTSGLSALLEGRTGVGDFLRGAYELPVVGGALRIGQGLIDAGPAGSRGAVFAPTEAERLQALAGYAIGATSGVGKTGRTVQQQIEALRQKGIDPAEAARTMNVAPEAQVLRTQTAAQFDPAKMTRTIQTALGQTEGGGMPKILEDYGARGPFAPKDKTKHGGVIGAATRAVMAGDKDIIDVLGPDLTQQLTQSKMAQLARAAGATEDAIRAAFGIMDNAVAAVSPEVKSAIRQAVREGTPVADDPTTFAGLHKALTQAGLPVTDDAVAALSDKLVAEARRVNKAVASQTATLDEATKAGGSLFKAEGQDIVGAMPPSGAPPAPPKTPKGPQPFDEGGFRVSVTELINLPRALQATGDVSQLFRQGLIPLVSAAISRDPARRVIARDAFKNAIRGYSDRFAGETWERAMKDPLFQRWKERGGFEAGIPAESLRALQKVGPKEEQFQSHLAESIPVVGGVVSAAERSYGLTLNALRFETFKTVYNAAKVGGKPLTVKEEEALAKWLNVASGRGSLGAFGQAAPVLNALLFAPRFAVSRIEAPVLTAQLLLNPETRRIGTLAAQDIAKTVTAGFALLELADAAGAKVGWDPTSSEFGKIRVGNTTVDIWGGFEQPAVLAARVAMPLLTSLVTGQPTAAEFGQSDAWDRLASYARGKLGPTPGNIVSILTGKDFVGKPFGPVGGVSPEDTVKALTVGSIVPMSWEDIVTAIADDVASGTSASAGLPAGSVGGVAGAGGALGFGVTTYQRPTRRDGLGRNIDEELPDHPVLLAWDAARKRSEARAKASGGKPDVPELRAPDKNVGTGERAITLDDKETDRLRVLVGQEREKAITQLIQSPMFTSLDPRRQEDLLLSTKADADRAGQQAFSIELTRAAADDISRVRAIRIGLMASKGIGERMDFVAKVAGGGALTPLVEGAIDDLRAQTDPTKPQYEPSVNELLTWSANAQRYASAPPWRVGDQATWVMVAQQGSRLRRMYNDLRREADAKGVPVQSLSDYQQYVKDYGATVVGTLQGKPLRIGAFIDLSGDARREMVSPQRSQIEALPMWDRFRDAVTARDPYAIRSK